MHPTVAYELAKLKISATDASGNTARRSKSVRITRA